MHSCKIGFMDKPVIRISVRNLVEFILRSGDLDSRSKALPDGEAMLAGSRIHRKIQGRRQGNYQAEVSLKGDVEFDDMIIRIEGRADGVYEKDGLTIIEEIKGVYRNVQEMEEPVPVHLAQARFYGALLKGYENELQDHDQEPSKVPSLEVSKENPNGETKEANISLTEGDMAIVKENKIGVRMTYANLDDETIRHFDLEYTVHENAIWFLEVVREYHKWESFRLAHALKRNVSAAQISFPFDYRKGQRNLVASVYHAIHVGRQLFIEAPTGVGKTMSVVFPSVRSMSEGLADRIFYLTARTVTRTVAAEAFNILRNKGLDFKYALLMAKEKICPMAEANCNPETCPYAKGHFDRVNEAAFEILNQEDVYDSESILAAAKKHMVCPFELSLDVAEWADGIICDYNYVFDPDVRLKRFFGDGVKSRGIILVDEAHNLVDRGREMFSASLVKEHVLKASRQIKDRAPRVERSLKKLNHELLDLKHEMEEETMRSGKTYKVLKNTSGIEVMALRLFSEFKEYFENNHEPALFNELSDFYFELRTFTQVADLLDENYIIYMEKTSENEFILHLSCMNPAENLQAVMDKAVDTIFFSATLLPVDYYKKLFSTREDDYAVYAETPFDTARRALLIGRDVSTRYKMRGEGMYRKIARYIHDTVQGQKGNYLAFFPSYKVMEDVLEIYRKEFDEEDVDWIVQGHIMKEDDREIFLENFYEDPVRSLVGFCVMGGIFSEGIDLIGTRLIGAMVVGTGLPQISNEREIIREFYDRRRMDGFGYAYRIPGMNKVMQAAGRVIRTIDDKGVILLLDERFMDRDVRRLFPREWRNAKETNVNSAQNDVRNFWNVIQCTKGDEKIQE